MALVICKVGTGGRFEVDDAEELCKPLGFFRRQRFWMPENGIIEFLGVGLDNDPESVSYGEHVPWFCEYKDGHKTLRHFNKITRESLVRYIGYDSTVH